MQQTIRIKRLNADAILPTRGSDYAAGADLRAVLDTPVEIKPGQTVMIGTGIAMEIPEGFVGLVFARSGLACKEGIAPANKVGVIDSDYRGEIKVALHNHSKSERTVENGQRIAQIVIVPFAVPDFVEAVELSDTERGQGGFGSTGKR